MRRDRDRWKVLQVSTLPDGGTHVAVVGHSATRGGAYGARTRAVDDTVGHYTTHRNRDGGYVGVCPAPYGVAVQLHAPDGTVESWRLFRVVGS